MNAERHTGCGHFFENRHYFFDILDTTCRIRCRTRRIEFDGSYETVPETCDNIVPVAFLGQIKGHQRFEEIRLRFCRHDPLAIGAGIGRRNDWRDQIRHDDRARKMKGGISDHRFEHFAIA